MEVSIKNAKMEYRPVLTVDFEFYCGCGEMNSVYDAHFGAPGYEDETEVTCKSCGNIWEVVLKATPKTKGTEDE